MLSIGMMAITSGDPPSGSRQVPTIVPPSRSTRVTTSRTSADEASKRQSNGSSPFVFGVALRDARLRLAGGFAGIEPLPSKLFRNDHWFAANIGLYQVSCKPISIQNVNPVRCTQVKTVIPSLDTVDDFVNTIFARNT